MAVFFSAGQIGRTDPRGDSRKNPVSVRITAVNSIAGHVLTRRARCAIAARVHVHLVSSPTQTCTSHADVRRQTMMATVYGCIIAAKMLP